MCKFYFVSESGSMWRDIWPGGVTVWTVSVAKKLKVKLNNDFYGDSHVDKSGKGTLQLSVSFIFSFNTGDPEIV